MLSLKSNLCAGGYKAHTMQSLVDKITQKRHWKPFCNTCIKKKENSRSPRITTPRVFSFFLLMKVYAGTALTRTDLLVSLRVEPTKYWVREMGRHDSKYSGLLAIMTQRGKVLNAQTCARADSRLPSSWSYRGNLHLYEESVILSV